MAGTVRIDLCGDLRVELGGRRRERELPGRLGRALLAYLALNRHRSVSRDELIEALWPGGPASDRAATLSTLLSALRRTLGPELVHGRGELRLDLPPGSEVDVERAAAQLELARVALADGDEADARAGAEAALDVLEHPLLPAFEAPWVDDRRVELEEERLEALELLARSGISGGTEGLVRAQAAARRLVSLAPYRESGYALLMEAHALRGNVAEALQVFERLRVLMREELGTTPSAEIRAVHERLLVQTGEKPASAEAASAEAASAEAAAPQRPTTRPAEALPLPVPLAKVARRPFVGREVALGRLREWLGAAGEGRRRFAFLAGEPGIGKTSLAAAFAREAREGGAIVLYGRSDEDTLVPYQPFVDMISHCVVYGGVDDLSDELRFELEELGRLVPELRRHLPALHEPLGGLPETDRYRLFEAVVTTLARVSGTGTLVLVFDDLHWADPPTLRLLGHLARASEPSRLLVVGAYRDVELEAGSPLALLLADVRREEELERLSLGGLDEQEAGALISARRAALPPGTAERLREMTAGNPFFLEETLRVLADADAEGVPAERALEQLGVPEGITEVVLRRVTRVGDRALELLTLGAVAGDSFRLGLLDSAGESRAETVDVLERALAARLLVESDQGDSLSFSHALIRHALYGRLKEARRVELHRQVAETLRSRRAELRPHPAELARHFFQARHELGPDAAVGYAREAAERASESLAWEEAVAQLERALEAEELRDPGDPEERCELLLALGEARLRAGHPAARETFAEAAELARGRFPRLLGLAAIGYGGRYYEAGVVDEALIALLREALEALGEEHSDLRAQLLGRLAEILHFAGDQQAALSLSAEAAELAQQLGDDHVLAAALAGRHVSLLHIEHLDERAEVSAELLELSRRTGDRERELQALHARIFDLLQLGDPAAAARDLAALRELANELRQPLFQHFAVGWECSMAQLEGRLEDAELLALHSLELRQRLQTHDAASVFAAQLFTIRRAQGRLSELLPAVEDLVRQYPDLAAWRAGLPLIQLAAGEEDAARAELGRFAADLDAIPADFFWLTAMAVLGEAAAFLADEAAAAEIYRRLAPYATRSVQVGYAGPQGPVARVLGLLAASLGDRDAALANLDDARRRSEAAGAVLFEVQAATELAELLAGSDDPAERERGTKLAAVALAKALELGMGPAAGRLARHAA